MESDLVIYQGRVTTRNLGGEPLNPVKLIAALVPLRRHQGRQENQHEAVSEVRLKRLLVVALWPLRRPQGQLVVQHEAASE
eukprot:2027575-Amphidinium_carterae.1